ncbi:THAP domain containing protein 4 [Echinococcus multilocularis]|uniref:THAP domain containing protein 4 n=1 Tax=Echinococcus multilocularis TaxID=6211 RepID=A0A068Y7V7_ECHMU|nr:THAP domain containing protein 4 [Echinococcus multilocularis]
MSHPPPDCPIHHSLQPFAKLIGEWEGQGSVSIYTRTTYPCSENISIGHIGQPSFWYSSRAYSGEAFRHRDMGFIFFNEETGQMYFMCSDNTGHVHILAGRAKNDDGKVQIVLETELTEGHPLPKKSKMIRVRREISLIDDDTLTQKVFMATEKKTDLTLHSHIVYKRLPKLIGSRGL